MPGNAVQPPPDFLRRDRGGDQDQIARAKLVLDGQHRVSGVIEQSGPSRRLVDVLNTVETLVVVRDALVEDFTSPGEEPRHYDSVQIKREAILLAMPASTTAPPPGSSEVVEKRPAAATLVLPGLVVTGHVYLPPEADPGTVRLVGRAGFLPVTHAEVRQVALGGVSWREPLVVVNLGRVQLYAPAPR